MILVLDLEFLGVAQGFLLQFVHASRWWLERKVERQTRDQQVAGLSLKVQTKHLELFLFDLLAH
jgi:hypothetical protein